VVAVWIFLTLGIVLGMWWAYGQPDWEGEWTGDAIGNAALFPWLVNTVLLHLLGARERRGELRRVTMTLLLLGLPLALFSTFLADGGVISSAHSFAQSPVSGWVAGFLVLVVGAATYLLLTRLHGLNDDDESRAASSLAPRRLGTAIVYAGLAVSLVALAGQAWREEHRLTLSPGASGELRDPLGRTWQFTSQGVSQYNELNRSVVAAPVDVARAGRGMGIVTSERRQYLDSRGAPTFEPATTAGILGSLEQDVYITLVGVGEDETVRLRVGFHPLVIWVWIGGAIMVLGGILLFVGTAVRRGG
jgi:cytochrome c biogenesis factor